MKTLGKPLSLIVIITILLEYFLSNGVFTAYLISVVFVLFACRKFSLRKHMFPILIPIVLLSLIGLHSLYTAEPYMFLKDGFYHFKIIVIILFGHLIVSTQDSPRSVLLPIVFGIAILCIFHFFQVLSRPDLISEMNGLKFRQQVNFGIDGSTITVPIIFYLRSNKLINRGPFLFILFFVVFSIFFSFSRTLTVELLIFMIAYLFRNVLGLYRFGVVFSFLALALIATGSLGIDYKSSVEMSDGFILWKYANSINEIKFSDYDSNGERLNHLRGYEGFRVLNKFEKSRSTIKRMFGFGFGSYLDWSDMYRNTNKNPKVSLLHNGYLIAFLKTGLVGLFILLVFMIRVLYKKSSLRIPGKGTSFSLIFCFIGAQLLVNTFVVGGIFNIHSMFCSLLVLSALWSHEYYWHRNLENA